MLYFTICDDEQAQLTLLKRYLEEWAKDRKYEIEADLCENAGQFLFRQGYERETDILLLDIDMPGKSGIALARELRQKGENLQIIFITGLTDYALEGYDVEAVSYLLKPVKKEKLFLCLDKARERLGKEEPALVLETAGGMARVRLKDICYLESAAHDTLVHCVRMPGKGYGGMESNVFAAGAQSTAFGAAEVIRSKTGIHGLEEYLKKCSTAFFKVHRSYLVNLSCVSRITRKEVVMDTGEALPVARGRWEALNKAYLEYYRGRHHV